MEVSFVCTPEGTIIQKEAEKLLFFFLKKVLVQTGYLATNRAPISYALSKAYGSERW